jgi:arginine deiminase
MSKAGEKKVSAQRITIDVRSEYASLKTVLVHRPGLEIDRLTPDNMETLLFEDIPYLPNMQKEHDDFVAAMRAEGIEVLYLEDLLLEILQDEKLRIKLVTLSCSFLVPSLANLILDNIETPQEIMDVLFHGVTAKEFLDKTNVQLAPNDPLLDPFLLEPIPNAYFSRDPAASLCSHVVSCKTHFPARVRETFLVREVFRNHPRFDGLQFIYGEEGAEDRPFTIEGGDIIIINSKAVAVGRSQRTRAASIATLAKRLFNKGLAERVYEIPIPDKREYMHLDTVFTIVNEGLVVAYPEVMKDVKRVVRHEPLARPYTAELDAISFEENRTFNDILKDEFGQLTVINTGSGKEKRGYLRYAAREQRADGTNVLAIAPSVVITYDRNTHTNDALKAAGVRVIPIPGSELVRGLGGPRCMTMPLQREVKRSKK